MSTKNTDPAAVTEDGVEIQLYSLQSDLAPGERPHILLVADEPGEVVGEVHLRLGEVDALKLATGILGLLHHNAEQAENARMDAILKRYNDSVAQRLEGGA